jgi:hypothetical protein
MYWEEGEAPVELETAAVGGSVAMSAELLNRKGEVDIVEDLFMRSCASLWAEKVSRFSGRESVNE